MADQIVEALKSRKIALEKELNQVNSALKAFTPAVATGAAVIAKPARKPRKRSRKSKAPS